jgi:hypothetical protein
VILHQKRDRPEPWHVHASKVRSRWLLPFHAFDWLFDWVAHLLSRWVFLEVLEYLGSFSVLIAVTFYFAESGDRLKQKHYQAWQVINTAEGKGGSGGRIDALQELNADDVPLVGIDLSDAFLQGLQLRRARLPRSRFGSADLRDSSFVSANLAHASFNTANLRNVDFSKADLRWTDFTDADLSNATLAAADLEGAKFDKADLRRTNLQNIRWQKIASVDDANFFGVSNPPPGFEAWARQHGAVFVP